MSILILSILIAIFEIPIFYRNVSNTVCYGLIVLFFISNINIYLNLDVYKKNAIYSILIYLIYITIFKLLNISSADLSYYSTTVKCLFICIAFIAIFDILTNRQKVYLSAFTLIVILIVVIDNFRLYLEYGAYRFVYLFQNARFTTNSVNTVFVSALMFLAGTLFVYFSHSRRRIQRILALIISVVLIIFSVGIAQRTIILLLSLMMFPLLILVNSDKTKTRIFLNIVALFLFLVLAMFYENILYWFAELSGSERLQVRVNQLIVYLSSRDISAYTGSGAARLNLIMTSLQTFVSSFFRFLFGAGDHRVTNEIIGNHSLFIDEFARYGIVGGLIFINMFRMFFKTVIRNSNLNANGALYRQLKVIMLIIVMRGLVGDLLEPTITIQLFLIIPTVFYMLENNKAVLS